MFRRFVLCLTRLALIAAGLCFIVQPALAQTKPDTGTQTNSRQQRVLEYQQMRSTTAAHRKQAARRNAVRKAKWAAQHKKQGGKQ